VSQNRPRDVEVARPMGKHCGAGVGACLQLSQQGLAKAKSTRAVAAQLRACMHTYAWGANMPSGRRQGVGAAIAMCCFTLNMSVIQMLWLLGIDLFRGGWCCDGAAGWCGY
jgi:hypothetical protein